MWADARARHAVTSVSLRRRSPFLALCVRYRSPCFFPAFSPFCGQVHVLCKWSVRHFRVKKSPFGGRPVPPDGQTCASEGAHLCLLGSPCAGGKERAVRPVRRGSGRHFAPWPFVSNRTKVLGKPKKDNQASNRWPNDRLGLIADSSSLYRGGGSRRASRRSPLRGTCLLGAR